MEFQGSGRALLSIGVLMRSIVGVVSTKHAVYLRRAERAPMSTNHVVYERNEFAPTGSAGNAVAERRSPTWIILSLI